MLHHLGTNTRWLALSYLLWGVGEGLWLYVQPLYAADLGANPAQIGGVMSVMALVRVFANLPAGWLADRYPPRRVMLLGWYLGMAGVVGIALAPDWRWLIPAFMLYGLSGCGVPTSAAYANRVVALEREARPQQTFARVLTTLFAAYSAGLVVSPAVGGWLGERLGLRAVFVISVGWFALSLVAALRTRPVPPAARQPGPGYGGLLKQTWLMAALASIGLTFAAAAAVAPSTGLTPKFMEDVRGLEVATIGLLGSTNALGMALLSLVLGRDSKPLRAFAAALALIWVAAGLFLSIGSPAAAGVGYFLVGSVGAARPLVESAIMPHVREDQRGVVLAVVESVFSLGTAVGTSLAGALYAGLGPGAPFQAALIALPLAGALCWRALRAPGRVHAAVRHAA